MIVDRLMEALRRFKASRLHLPQSLMGKAINYALNNTIELRVYLDNGNVGIDNNPVDKAIRPSAIGRKNCLFIGSNEAAWRSAVNYSIIESCRNQDIDPYAYLRNVLTRLPTITNWEIVSITPKPWTQLKIECLRDAS